MPNELKVIAHIECGFPEKFGIPRQSGMVMTDGRIIMHGEYAKSEAFRGIDGYSHLWLIWGFTGFDNDKFSPTVRPPRLGGNKRVGVFSTRSPNRPNPIGLSAVELVSVEEAKSGIILNIRGADLKNGTEIYDIKPYLPFTDSHPDAKFGFSEEKFGKKLNVEFSSEIAVNDEKFLSEIKDILADDPRPQYQDDGRVYGMSYRDYEIKFTVDDDTVKVNSIIKENSI